MWTFDLETDALPDVTRVWCGVFKEHGTGQVSRFGPSQIEAMLEFMDTIDHLVGHNCIGFDFYWLEKLYGYKYKGKITDTLILSQLLKPNRAFNPQQPIKKSPHSVEAWGWRLGVPKQEHEDWTQYSDEMLSRCDTDVDIQMKIYVALQGEKRHGSWNKAEPMTMRLFEILKKSEEHGWLVDQDHMHKSLSMLEHWIRKIDIILSLHISFVRVIDEGKIPRTSDYRFVKTPFIKSGRYSAVTQKFIDSWLTDLMWACRDTGHFIDITHDNNGEPYKLVGGPYCRVHFRPTNLNSGTETKEFLLKEGWTPKEYNYDEYGNETSPKLSKDDPFDGLEGGVGRMAARRVQCRHRQSTILGWFKVIRPDGRISQRVTGLATTGRAKHQRIVNVPNGEAFFGLWMRKIFIVPEDKVLIGVDSAGCQSRMLAARCGDPEFTTILLDGKKEDKTSIHYVNQKALADHGITASYGQCKNSSYAFMFGAGDSKLGRIIPGNSGETIRKAMLSVSAGFANLVESLQAQWRNTALTRFNKKWNRLEYYNGYVIGLDGRPVYIASEHAILVYVLQSDEAIMMQYAYLFLYKWLSEEGLVWGEDWAYVAYNHDEFQIECKKEHEELVTRLGCKSIAHAGEYLNIACPHKGEADSGRSWADTH